MPSYICTTCGVAYAETEHPREVSLICADDRQYVNAHGQSWTTLDQLREDHVNELREVEPGLLGIGSSPKIAIGERALVIQRPEGGVMWDCTPLITDAALRAIEAKGGIKAIAISHPHFYATMVDWSRALGGVPVYLHDWYGPGRTAMVVSTRSPEYKASPGEYHEDAPLTGDESRVREVKDVNFPALLDPVDDLPPITVVTHIEKRGGKLLVHGSASDNGEIKRVVVNGQSAQIDASGSSWQAELHGDTASIAAHSEDAAGNVEKLTHKVQLK